MNLNVDLQGVKRRKPAQARRTVGFSLDAEDYTKLSRLADSHSTTPGLLTKHIILQLLDSKPNL